MPPAPRSDTPAWLLLEPPVEEIPVALVAIFNTNEDIVEALQLFLQHEGFLTVSAHVPDISRGRIDLVEFVERHQPDVIVYDVSPPYEESWNLLRLLRDTEALRRRVFVLTTTNKRVLEDLVGPTEAYEIVGKPFDMAEVARAVRAALVKRRLPPPPPAAASRNS
jgi:DNA-binding response OmpR family regulator